MILHILLLYKKTCVIQITLCNKSMKQSSAVKCKHLLELKVTETQHRRTLIWPFTLDNPYVIVSNPDLRMASAVWGHRALVCQVSPSPFASLSLFLSPSMHFKDYEHFLKIWHIKQSTTPEEMKVSFTWLHLCPIIACSYIAVEKSVDTFSLSLYQAVESARGYHWSSTSEQTKIPHK